MKSKKKGKIFLFYLFLGALFLKTLTFLFPKKNCVDTKTRKKEFARSKDEGNRRKHKVVDFLKKEEGEVQKFIFGKEPLKDFFHHSFQLFANIFIPHNGNGHKPKILRSKSLISIAIGLFVVKVFLGTYLFLAFPDSAYMSENLVGRVTELVNIDRAKNNLPILSRNDELTRAAVAKAEDMLAGNYFDHYGPDGKKPWEWINRTEYDYIFAGENLAMNFVAAESVYRALMSSEGHRKNILSERYLDIGVAMVSGEINGKQTNILVQTFGHKRRIVAPVVHVLKADERVQEEVSEKISALGVLNERMVLGTSTALIDISSSTLDASSSLVTIEKVAPMKEVSMVVRGKIMERTEVKAEKNYLEIENDTLVTVRAAPEIVGESTVITREKMILINYIFMIVVGVIGVLLAVNIFVGLRIQHKTVIAQTIFTIIFISSLIYFKFHYLEGSLADILLM